MESLPYKIYLTITYSIEFLIDYIQSAIRSCIYLRFFLALVRWCSFCNGCCSPARPVAASRTTDQSSIRSPSTRVVLHRLTNHLHRFDHRRISHDRLHQLVLFDGRLATTGETFLWESSNEASNRSSDGTSKQSSTETFQNMQVSSSVIKRWYRKC